MQHNASSTVLIVPGLRDHVPEHWQTILEGKLERAVSVPRMASDAPQKLSRGAWVQQLEQAVARIRGPIVLVAHSAGCAIVVHWAAWHDTRRIKGALLATPADLESPLPDGYPTQEVLAKNGWTPMPRDRLPFPSVVAASTNDPLGRFERVAELGASWGSRIDNIGAVGHLNPASGFGEWRRAHAFIERLDSTA